MTQEARTPAPGPKIVLRPGTLRVDIQDVPRLIAEALYPPEACNGPMTVSYLCKVTPESPLGRPVTDKELEELNAGIWAQLQPYKNGIPESEWVRYDAAFSASSERPPWTLVPVWINPGYNGDGGAIMRAQAEAEHQVMLGKALIEGRATAITHAGVPVLNPFLGHGVYIAVGELTRYLSELPLPIVLRVGEPEPQDLDPPARTLQVSKQNDEVVLAAIRAAGYDPLELPPRKNGKPWVKAEARKICRNLSKSQFTKAWERLNQTGRISEKV